MSGLLRSQVLAFFRDAVQKGTFNRVLQKVEITDVHKGRLSAELLVSDDCCNVINMLHGGMSATLVDHLSTLALRSHFLADNQEPPGSVSIELSMSYLSAVPNGDTIRLETEAIRVGKNMAFLTASIYNKKNNKLVATGKHTKFLLAKQPKPSASSD